MNVKKIFCYIIVSLIFVTSITGCNSLTTGYNVEQTNLELSVLIDGLSDDQLNGITSAFKKAYPEIKLTIFNEEYYTKDNQPMKWGEIAPKIETQIMAGKGPDVFVVGTWGVFGDLKKTIKSGAFYDLNKIFKKSKAYNKDDYLKPAMTAGQYDGGQYIFPISLYTPMLVTTTENMEETGIDLDNCMNYFGLMEELDVYHNRAGIDNTRTSLMPHLLSNITLMNAYDDDVKFDTKEVKDALVSYKECDRNSKLYPNPAVGESNFSMFLTDRVVFSDEYWGYDALNLASQLNERFEPIFLPKYNSNGQIQAEIDCGLAVNAASPNMGNVEKFFEVLLTADEPSNALDNEEYIQMYGSDGKYDNVQPEERYRFEGVKNMLPANKLVFKRSLECKRKKLNDGYIYNSYSDIEENRAIKITPLTDDYYNQFEDMYNNIEVCTLPSRKISLRVYNYFLPYFNDEATLESCLETAQSAMEIYISE